MKAEVLTMDTVRKLQRGEKVFAFQGQHFVLLEEDPGGYNVGRAEKRDGTWCQIGDSMTPFSKNLIKNLESEKPFTIVE